MPIDTTVHGSPGWWMKRLSGSLQREQARLALLNDYASGRPPLAWGSENLQSKFYRFQQQSRTNFAEVIVEAPCERMALRSIGTAADSDANGDAKAWGLVTANDLVTALGEAARWAKTFGRAYLATSLDEDGQPVITAEDPRQVITEADPIRRSMQRAAYKAYHDPEASLDVVVLWLTAMGDDGQRVGQKWIATRQRKTPVLQTRSAGRTGAPEPVWVPFAPGSFDMCPMRPTDPADVDPEAFYSEEYDVADIPVEPILNKFQGVGEFEMHTDLLDRINHMILQRVVIATLQAFRQRALKQSSDEGAKELPENDPVTGEKIDYSGVLEGGPDAVWLLPPGADIWESGQADLQGILSSVKDDVLHLSAVTGTPMSMFTPDAAAQTAEGAQLMRERLVFKVEDFQRVMGRALARSIARGFRYLGDSVRGDASRVTVDWMPAERYSLAEMGSAASQVVGTLTWEQTQEVVWQQTPTQIALAKAQRADDMVLAAQAAALQAQRVNGDGPAGQSAS